VTALRCAEVEARLVDAIDGRLDSADSVRFHAHLEGCAACRERAALWRRLVPEMRGAVAPAPGAMATRRMQIEIERRLGAERRAPAPVTRRWRWVPALALAAAAAAVALWFRAPPVGYAAFGDVRGAVSVGDHAAAGAAGARVPIGAPIALGAGAALKLLLDGGATLAVEGPGGLTLEGSARAVAVRLSAGTLHAEVTHRQADQTFAVLTPDLRVEVRGTKFGVQATPAGSRVDVTEGQVAVRFADGRQTLVSAGGGASTLSPEPPREQPLPEAQPLAPRPSGDERSPATGRAAAPGTTAGRCVEVARSCETTAGAVRATMRGGGSSRALRQIAEARRELRAAGPRCEESASACEDELGYLHAEVLNQAGRLDDAVAAYRALDRRGAPAAMRQNALYAAGQIERRQGRPAAAASDFERALAAAPRGALREDALVGAMESAQAAGQVARARGLAGRYLYEYPRGLAAPAAERLTGRGGP